MSSGTAIGVILQLIASVGDFLGTIPGLPQFIFRAKMMALVISLFFFGAWVYIDLIKRPYLSGWLYRKKVYLNAPLTFKPERYVRQYARARALIAAKQYTQGFTELFRLLETIALYYGELYGPVSSRLGGLAPRIIPNGAELKEVAAKIEAAQAGTLRLKAEEIPFMLKAVEQALADFGAPVPAANG